MSPDIKEAIITDCQKTTGNLNNIYNRILHCGDCEKDVDIAACIQSAKTSIENAMSLLGHQEPEPETEVASGAGGSGDASHEEPEAQDNDLMPYEPETTSPEDAAITEEPEKKGIIGKIFK